MEYDGNDEWYNDQDRDVENMKPIKRFVAEYECHDDLDGGESANSDSDDGCSGSSASEESDGGSVHAVSEHGTSKDVQNCWFCLEECRPEDDIVRPCKCKGSVGVCHHKCLLNWIAVQESENWNQMQPIHCPVCKTQYVVFSNESAAVYVYNLLDTTSYLMSSVFCSVFAVATVYTSLTLYGALSLCQVMGYEQGFKMIKKCSYGAFFIALPSIPASLLSGAWMSYFIKCMVIKEQDEERRRRLRSGEIETADELHVVEQPSFGTREFAGTLLLPFVGGIGRVLLPKHFGPNLQRSLIGAIVIILAKNNMISYFEYLKQDERKTRRILNYRQLQEDGQVAK